jgi:hypothetical protein
MSPRTKSMAAPPPLRGSLGWPYKGWDGSPRRSKRPEWFENGDRLTAEGLRPGMPRKLGMTHLV